MGPTLMIFEYIWMKESCLEMESRSIILQAFWITLLMFLTSSSGGVQNVWNCLFWTIRHTPAIVLQKMGLVIVFIVITKLNIIME